MPDADADTAADAEDTLLPDVGDTNLSSDDEDIGESEAPAEDLTVGLSVSECVEKANTHKAEGNEHFKAARSREAVECYKLGVRYLSKHKLEAEVPCFLPAQLVLNAGFTALAPAARRGLCLLRYIPTPRRATTSSSSGVRPWRAPTLRSRLTTPTRPSFAAALRTHGWGSWTRPRPT